MISFTTEDFTAGRRRRSVEQLPQQLSAALAVPGARCPSLAELAQGLCVSTRTLKRRLQARGLSYRRLLDQARLGRAAELLQQSRRPLEAIAAELGYSSSANFSRAFRRW
ncbi:MAG TPA: helix-turn-helix transcriptional regulator, partial [Solimonas sp.]|nr:helix-turn-helix transcriptional regulator [Solimonas sp.]